MKANVWRFNLFLALMAAMAVTLCGCQTASQRESKLVGVLRIYLEAGDAGTGQTVSVLRTEPVVVSVANMPVLSEANIVASRLINAPGGFAIEVQFDENGTWLLEQYSAANPGKHFVIYGQWGKEKGEGRWLAAPLITRRISNGVLAFTPDASQPEASQLVTGLNNVAKQANKGKLK